jgi:hypothetical protein
MDAGGSLRGGGRDDKGNELVGDGRPDPAGLSGDVVAAPAPTNKLTVGAGGVLC